MAGYSYFKAIYFSIFKSSKCRYPCEIFVIVIECLEERPLCYCGFMDGIRKKLYQKTISYINNLSVHSRYFILENRTHYPVTKVRRDAMKIGFIGAGKVGFSLENILLKMVRMFVAITVNLNMMLWKQQNLQTVKNTKKSMI